MGKRAIPTVLAGFAAWFTVVTAEATQNDSLCFATVAASLETSEAGNQAKLIRSRIRESGLRPAKLRLRLANLGYHPSTVDPYLDGVCSVPLPSDSVRNAKRMAKPCVPEAKCQYSLGPSDSDLTGVAERAALSGGILT